MSNISFVEDPNSTSSVEVSPVNPLPVDATVNVTIAGSQNEAATSSTSGTVAATNAPGGTQIIAANPDRNYAQCQNNGGVNCYFGTGTVTSSFLKVLPAGIFRWDSIEELKVLSSGVNCNIAYLDYSN